MTPRAAHVFDWMADLLAGGKQRRLDRAVARLETLFAPSTLKGEALDRAAAAYRRALRLALRVQPSRGAALHRSHDGRLPADCYSRAFGAADREWLGRLAHRDDPATLTVVMEVAFRLGLGQIQGEAAGLLTDMLARCGDADRLVTHLLRRRQLQLLSADGLERALRAHVARASLERDGPLWSSFFASLPEAMLPPLFEVHHFLGRGADAVRLADTPARQQQAVSCCRQSPRLSDVWAGRDLARRMGDTDAARRLQERAGDLLVAAGNDAEAVESYREAGRPDRMSECYERLGQFFEALAACPAERAERLARLAGTCQSAVDALVERQELVEAAEKAQQIVANLERAAQSETVAARRAEAAALRAGVLAAGRQHFRRLAQQATAAYGDWSRFEEAAGELARAAQRAEDAGDRYRAHRLFRQAGLFGEAVRVLQVDATPEALASRAEASAEGGDPVGAARLYEQAGRPEKAAQLFEQAGELRAAVRCLRRHLGEGAIESPQLLGCLRKAGALEELVQMCVEALRRKERCPRAAEQMRSLLDEGSPLPPELAEKAQAALDDVGARGRRAFEERAQAWVARARAEVDRRYAAIWGLDLGTTTCSAAVYDAQTKTPILCPWKGRDQFASTLSLDEHGNELVGLAGEESFAHGVVGQIIASKRKMGTRAAYRLREREYRPEEVAARFIRHARGLVEGFLTGRVRERVGELARAELGEIHDEWLHWAAQHHDLRPSRPGVVVTIPAYFLNNQKHATRDACRIAGVEVMRLLHEPTAACMAVGRERGLSGRVVVVDLGAGTLDVSFLDVGEGIYEVREVLGNNHYGGKDFDAAISAALADRLRGQGLDVPDGGLPRRRLEVAAEYLKIELSTQQHSDFLLRSFQGGKDVRLELSLDELESILAPSLRTLSETCTDLKKSLKEPPQHLVLVGGPMLAPLVRRKVEQVFGMARTGVSDPRTAVACGAALQGAVLDGKLKEILLVDVTPLSLGIRAFDQQDREHFSLLIDRNTTIPVSRQRMYSTKEDNQAGVDVEIFQERLEPQSKIGQFKLEGIRPAKKGEPQIEVTFAIDASCVLEVTARDRQTGLASSIKLADTTLLAPAEREAMARHFQQQQELESRRHQLRELIEDLVRLVADAAGSGSEALLREWQSRLAAYRPSAAPLDAQTQQDLCEMFNKANELESELLQVEVPLRDLSTRARQYLDTHGKPAAGPLSPQALAAALAEGQHLAGELARHLRRLRPLRGRLATWNALLVKLATAETDPLRRFRASYQARDYARALEALAETTPLEHLPDILKQLSCLARLGDAAGYRSLLLAHGPRLGLVPFDPDRPDHFLARVRPALVQVRVALADGRLGLGSGFLLSGRLVATNQHWLVEETAGRRTPVAAARVEVLGNGRSYHVEHIFLPGSSPGDVALLRLAEPAEGTPLRLGPSGLVRVGDPVWAIDPHGEALSFGVVNKLESFPEYGLRLFKVGLRMPTWCSGGPLLNDLGEVVGLLAIKDRPGESAEESCFAQTADALEPLLAAAGFNPQASLDLAAASG